MINKHSFSLNHTPSLKKELPIWRSRFVLGALLCGSLGLGIRALYLQAVNHEFLQEKGESRYGRVIELPSVRGRITDRHGDVLAMSSPVKSIWAIPEDAAKLNQSQLHDLAAMLDMDAREITRKLTTDKDFIFIKRQVSPEIAEQIASMKLPGIHDQKEYRRFYPGGEVAAHVMGFTGIDDRGQEGMELAYQNVLAGKPGSRRVIKDRRGNIVEDVGSIKSPIEGKDITLALDSKIQYLAYSALKQAIQEHKAKAGGIVVLDSKTGEILALVNMPTFNPNNRGKLSGDQLRNRALTDTYEPGSTMKPFTAALALDKGKFTFNTLINCAPGRMTIGTATISDAHALGTLTVAGVIQKSSNIGAAKMALTFAPETMWKMFDDLGFGSPLKLGFPGEVGGRLRPAKSWHPIEQATMSYGHGISVSLMQMANAYQVFARDGDMVPLSLVKVDTPPSGRQIFSPKTARDVRAMMEMVVSPEGTAVKAQVPGYRVGGKTGTAYKLEGGRYTRRYVASFIGIAPISDPRLVVAVMIDEPSNGKHYGGEVAAPVFSQVTGGALRALNIPPDAPLRPMQVARAGQVVLPSKEPM